MSREDYKVLGVMSGTSLDGVDLAEILLSYSESEGWSFELGIAETIPYSTKWKTVLNEAVNFSTGRLNSLNVEYTRYLGHLVLDFLKDHKLYSIDAVCSHGHTVLHRPDEKVTLQIGNLPEIAEIVRQDVVCDFRVQDVELGGQGAPLVPIGDRLLFGEYDYCLNLGGFANLSTEISGLTARKRIAFDVCPVNVVLNHYARQLGHEYDAGGNIAASGKPNETLFKKLNELPYYGLMAPKSLGVEWVHQRVFPLLNSSGLSPEDILRTFTGHVAHQLQQQFIPGSSILVSGGGAYNNFLLGKLKERNDLKIHIPEPKLVEYKEALVFGLLGVLRLRNEVNCLASVTGADRDHCSGKIFRI